MQVKPSLRHPQSGPVVSSFLHGTPGLFYRVRDCHSVWSNEAKFLPVIDGDLWLIVQATILQRDAVDHHESPRTGCGGHSTSPI